jgi:hypothetical protein
MDVLADSPTPHEINRRDDYDIEAMAKHPQTDTIYAFTGDQGETQDKKKMLVIDREDGIPVRSDALCGLGLDDNMEIQAASFNPLTNELWAAGDNTGLRVFSITPTEGMCDSEIKIPKDELGRPPEEMFWDNEGRYLYILYQSTSSTTPDGKIVRFDQTKPAGERFKDVCTGIKSAEGMINDLFGNIVVGYHHNSGNTIDVYRVEENQDGSFDCNVVATRTYENVDYNDVETMFFDSCSPVPELHCDNLYWLKPECGVPKFTEIFCAKLTMGESACVERWSTGMICDFNKNGVVQDIDLTDLSLRFGSTDPVDLSIYDMDSDRDIDQDDLEICQAFYLGDS